MLKKTTNSTVTYEPLAVSEVTFIKFQKTTDANGTKIYGKIVKNDAECGSLSYEEATDFLITSLKPRSKFTDAEVAFIYENAPKCIAEILSE